MSNFDPYVHWLQIDTQRTPLHYYSLLGLEDFCSDPIRIAEAADERMGQVRQHQLGKRAEVSQQVLNQLAAAKVTLLGADSKLAYDEQLRGWLASQQVSASQSTAAESFAPAAPTHALEEEPAPAGFSGFEASAPQAGPDWPTAPVPQAADAASTAATSPASGESQPRPIMSRQMASFLNAYLVPMIWGSILFALMAVFVILLLTNSGRRTGTVDKNGVEKQGSDADVGTQRQVIFDQRQVLDLPPGVALQRDDGDVMLEAANAQLTGTAQLTGEYVSGLTGPEDSLTWEFHILKPGIFQPIVTYSCDAASEGGEFKITAGDSRGWTRVRDTGGFNTFAVREANKMVMLKPAGRHTLTLSAADVPGGSLMNVQSILLKRNESGTMRRN
ncbi:MAG: hypothetical protein WD030_00965 [Pirellulales bacterium]